jgi:hypothetical protein
MQRENFMRYQNKLCDSVVVECDKTSLADGDATLPKDNVRLMSEDGTISDEDAAHIDDEGYLTTDNFSVTNSQRLEASQWHNSDASNTLKG